LVPGITPSRYEQLKLLGVNSLESLANACPINLAQVFSQDVALALQRQAVALLENRVIPKSEYFSANHHSIPTTSIELYFDIEAEPERGIDFLLGVFLVDRQNEHSQYYAFLAEKITEEGKIWQQFLTFVNAYPESTIFHYSEYEVETIKRLGQLYQTPKEEIKSLLLRCVDLHELVTTTLTLPVESYSLKSLANWLGFQWRDPGVGGDQSVCWYDSWLNTGDRLNLDLILRYNEDDCRATYHLKNWLVDFLTSLFVTISNTY
jgi:uncharacterized protein